MKTKVNSAGFSHIFIPLVAVVLVGIVGTYMIVASHALTGTTSIKGAGGFCLDNHYSRKTNGNPIQLHTCNGTGAQAWTVNGSATVADSIVNQNGFCLNVSSGGTANYVLVNLWKCDGLAAQQWTYDSSNGRIVNPASAKCLSTLNAGTINNTPVVVETCNGSAVQKWTVSSGGKPVPTPTPTPTPPPSGRLLGIGLSSIGNISDEQGDAAVAKHHLDTMNFFESFGTATPPLVTTRLNEMSANQTNDAIPMFTWMTCSFAISGSCNSTGTAYPLAKIAAGNYDPYIATVADAIKAYGGPVIIRLDHEMDGGWYPWGNAQGNTPAQYVAAWRDVHNVFAAQGVTNVKWFWCPNVSNSKTPQPYYPGDAYVDYVGEDGYNRPPFGPWRTPSQIFSASLAYLTGFAPSKPIIIGEVGTVESTSTWGNLAGQTKGIWIADLVNLIKTTPKGYGFVWSEWSGNEMDTSPAAQNAMAAALVGY